MVSTHDVASSSLVKGSVQAILGTRGKGVGMCAVSFVIEDTAHNRRRKIDREVLREVPED